MATELESLLFALEVDNRDLKRRLKEAEGAVDRFEKNSGTKFKRAGKSVDRFGDQMAASLKRAGAAVVAYASAQQVFAAIDAAGSLNRDAKAVGLTTQEYQELAFAVQATGVAIEQFRGSAGQFASQMGELRAETGGFYEFLRKHLPTVAEQLKQTKSVAEAYHVVAAAAAELQTQEERNIFVAKAFGEEGRKLTYLFEQGSEALKRYREEAHATGAVLSDELAQSADDLSRKFTVVSEAFETKWQSAVVNTGSVVLPLLEGMETGLASIGNTLRTLAVVGQHRFEALTDSISEMPPEVQAATASVKELMAALGSVPDNTTILPGLSNLAKNVEIQGKLSLRAMNEVAVEAADWKAEVDRTAFEAFRDLERQRVDLAGQTERAIQMDAEDQLARFKELLDDRKITEAEYNQARVQIYQNAAMRVADAMTEESTAAKEAINDIVFEIDNVLSGSLRDAFAGNMQSADEYFRRLVAGLGEAIVQATILRPLMDGLTQSMQGGGGLASVFSAFMPGRAIGGSMSPNVPHIVGERGPEIIVPKAAANVVPSMSGGGSTVYNIDARGADVGVEQRIAATLARIERDRKPATRQIGETRQRFPTRG